MHKMDLISRAIYFVKKKVLPGNAPNFFIVGAQKSGTTSLHFYLTQHPQLLGARPKETGFFHDDENYAKGQKWLHKHIKNFQGKKSFLAFESTPENLYISKAAERIKKDYPSAKIIIILRDPVKRAFSAWNMYRDLFDKRQKLDIIGKAFDASSQTMAQKLFGGDTFPDFESCIEMELDFAQNQPSYEGPSIIMRGNYFEQVKRYFDLFGKENVLVLGFKDISNNKIATLNEVLTFLDLPVSDWRFLNEETKHAIEYKNCLKIDTQTFLEKYYEDNILRLELLLGRKLNW